MGPMQAAIPLRALRQSCIWRHYARGARNTYYFPARLFGGWIATRNSDTIWSLVIKLFGAARVVLFTNWPRLQHVRPNTRWTDWSGKTIGCYWMTSSFDSSPNQMTGSSAMNVLFCINGRTSLINTQDF